MSNQQRPLRWEINDLTVRLMDSGLRESSARKVAYGIAESIGMNCYRKGLADGRIGEPGVEAFSDLVDKI